MKKIFPRAIIVGLFAIFLTPLRSPAQSPAHLTISGHVFDRATGLPLPDANVFIANTLPVDQSFNFNLKPTLLQAAEIVVSAAEDKKWRKNFKKEKEEYGYVEARMQRDLSLLGASPRALGQTQDQRPQTSWIALRQNETKMDILGHVYDPLTVTTFGYWAWERLAEKLPWEYSPHRAYLPEQPAGIADRDYYEEGIKLKTSGDWQKALDAWLQGKEVLAEQDESDPRIGIAFIELATEKNAAARYEQAGDLYVWGFSHCDLKVFSEEIAKEIERLAPLLSDNEHKTWRSDLARGDASLNVKIKNFWIEKDPTPSTKINERLLEHWQRIAHARRNFKKASNTIYDTDDRGLIYVKYGEPDRKKALQLGTTMDELYGLLEIYNLASAQSRQSAAVGEIRRALGAFLTFPECELWAYYSLQTEEPVIYVFGPKAGRGAYGLRNGVEEFIPEEAFRREGSGSRFTGGILPGALMQLMYYNELSAFDKAFAERYEELKTIWFRSSSSANFPSHNVAQSVREKYKIADAENPARRNAPADRSEAEKAVPPIQLVSYPARFLDDRNAPTLVFIAFTLPRGLGKTKPAARVGEITPPDYRLHYTLIVRDGSLNEMQRASAPAFSEYDPLGVVTIPHLQEHAHYTLAVEAFPLQPRSEPAATGKPIAAGKAFFQPMPQLNPNPQELEVSDLVIGVEPPPDFNGELLPYPVVPSRQIPKPDEMKVYLEVYHLRPDDGGVGQFAIDFRIIKLEQKGKKLKRAEMIASAFDFHSPAPMAKEDFGISISNLKPGDYELELEVQDKISGAKKQRSAPFQVATAK
jgi:GWxTD domain-containing protein